MANPNISSDLEEGENLSEENSIDGDGDSTLSIENNSHESKLDAIKRVLKRILIGIAVIFVGILIFFLGGFIGSGESIITLQSSEISTENNNKLVYLVETPTTKQFTDPLFKISTTGLELARIVEMYQWIEEDGNYIQKWSDKPVVISDQDAINKGFTNPTEMPFLSQKWNIEKITLGQFTLSTELSQNIGAAEPLILTASDFSKLSKAGQNAFKLSKDGYFFFGLDETKPHIGDLRIKFTSIVAAPITVLAKQSGEYLDPFPIDNGTIGIMKPGSKKLEAILEGVDLGENATLIWICRGISLLFIIVGGFIIKGRKRKDKTVENDDFDDDFAAKEQNVAPIRETTEQTPEEEPEQFNVQSSEDFMSDDTPAPSSEYQTTTPAFPEIIEPTAHEEVHYHTEAPTPLEFTSPEQPTEDTSINSVTSQLQQFGIIEDTDIPATTPPPPQDLPQANPDLASPSPGDRQPDNDIPASHENEMPFEVEFLSEEAIDSTPIEQNQPAVQAFDTIEETDISTDIPEPYESAPTAGGTMPEGVEIIYESDIDSSIDSATVSPPQENTVPEAIYEAESQFPVPPAPPQPEYGLEFDNNEETGEADNMAYPPMPPVPPTPEYEQEDLDSDESDMAPPAPPVPAPPSPPEPDLTQYDIDELAGLDFGNAPPVPPVPQAEYAEETDEDFEYEEEEYEDEAEPPLPPKPDFDKLFAARAPAPEYVPEAEDTHITDFDMPEAPEAPAPVPQPSPESDFDLPGIPEDFDPNAEMQAPEVPGYSEDEFENNADQFVPSEPIATTDESDDPFGQHDESHDPFGADDPFAVHDEEDKG